jgi:hypothetical protein
MSIKFDPAEQAVRERAMKSMFIVFDLDGTLSDPSHRIHFLEREKKDWRAFYAACGEDRPHYPIIRVLQALYLTGSDIEIWTGRSEEVREQTMTWLALEGIPHVNVKMREEGDHRPDTVLKLEWLESCSSKPRLVFEDRASVVEMWRANGIPCCQVAEGKF